VDPLRARAGVVATVEEDQQRTAEEWHMDNPYGWVLNYWTVTIFLPAVLLLIVVLAMITRIMDKKSEK
jgi:hypothetical protein